MANKLGVVKHFSRFMVSVNETSQIVNLQTIHPISQIPVELSHLTPRARQIYLELKQAREKSKKESI
jgi:hypothetical protein